MQWKWVWNASNQTLKGKFGQNKKSWSWLRMNLRWQSRQKFNWDPSQDNTCLPGCKLAVSQHRMIKYDQRRTSHRVPECWKQGWLAFSLKHFTGSIWNRFQCVHWRGSIFRLQGILLYVYPKTCKNCVLSLNGSWLKQINICISFLGGNSSDLLCNHSLQGPLQTQTHRESHHSLSTLQLPEVTHTFWQKLLKLKTECFEFSIQKSW